MDLNPAQFDAVNTLSGPLLVLAGAGTGKTRVVTYRIAELIRNRVPPNRILAVTFTNKAAAEMQQRATAQMGRKRKPPEISTFHSLCVRILRRHINNLGYPKSFAIYDRGDQESVARAALREIKVNTATLRPGDLINMIGGWKTASIHPAKAASMAQTDKEHLAAAAYRRYQNSLKAAGAVDFDDLLLCTEELFRRFPKVREAEAARFDHLLIDEYQDTNGSQYRIVKALAAGHRNLCVVGDDDQSIYGWRGADITHILRFKRDWPEAKVVRLETNYRSSREIVRCANTLIRFNKLRHDKVLQATFSGEKPRILQLEDEIEEAETVVADIKAGLQSKNRRPRDIAILFRTNEQPRPFEAELRKADVPYVLIGGMSFFDRKEVRDILAYLKLLVSPRDEISMLRIINTPPRGIGQSTVTRLMEAAIARGKPLWDILPKASSLDGMSGAALSAVEAFRLMIDKQRKGSANRSPVATVNSIIREIKYKGELARLYPKPEDQQTRWAAVEELVNAAARYSKKAARPTLRDFVQEMALSGPADQDEKDSQLQRNAVALMTMHSAKGLEFKEVYIVGMEEGLLPHRRSVADVSASAIDEERRLCYVGVTRAQRRLTLSLALNRHKWGKLRPTIPSRFLYELTGKADNPNYKKIAAKR
ncbi:MAG: UvrD-helicase domain-containing protein [Thermoguttaceae bacterium]